MARAPLRPKPTPQPSRHWRANGILVHVNLQPPSACDPFLEAARFLLTLLFEDSRQRRRGGEARLQDSLWTTAGFHPSQGLVRTIEGYAAALIPSSLKWAFVTYQQTTAVPPQGTICVGPGVDLQGMLCRA